MPLCCHLIAEIVTLYLHVYVLRLLVYSKSRTKKKQEKALALSDAILHTQNHAHPLTESAVEEIPFLEASDNTDDSFAMHDVDIANGHDDTKCDEEAMIK